MKTLCEWNPAREEIALTTGGARIGCHAPAAVLLGRYGEWHLCEGCARLALFAHFRERTMLTALLYTARDTKPQPLNTGCRNAVRARETRFDAARRVSSPSGRTGR